MYIILTAKFLMHPQKHLHINIYNREAEKKQSIHI